MKVSYSVVVLFAALAVIHGYPATKTEEKDATPDKDVDFVPLEDRRSVGKFPPEGVVDVDAGGFFGNPFVGNPFPSLLGSIEAIMARMRQQLSQILGRLPDKPGDSPFPELHLPNLGDIDLGKGNTTSVTKVIDGHKVTINETEYKQDGEDGAAFFKVRIIDVHPNSSDEASGEKDVEPVAPKGDRESTEDTFANEIPKTKDNEELNFDNLETFDEADLVPPHKFMNTRRNIDWGNLRSVESIEDNSIDAGPQPIRDLSNDIYVNQLMADRRAATNPEAEVFEVLDGRLSSQYYPQVKSEKIMTVNAAPLQAMKVQGNFPMSDFERVGIPQESMPFYRGKMPFFAPPSFSINEQRYSLPAEHMMPFPNERIFVQPFQSIKSDPVGNSFHSQPNFFIPNHESFPVEQIFIRNLPTQMNQPTENNEKQGPTTSKVVSEPSHSKDNQKTNSNHSKSSDESVTRKETVSQAVEQQDSSSFSTIQEVPQKHLSSTNAQVPST